MLDCGLGVPSSGIWGPSLHIRFPLLQHWALTVYFSLLNSHSQFLNAARCQQINLGFPSYMVAQKLFQLHPAQLESHLFTTLLSVHSLVHPDAHSSMAAHTLA